MNYKPLGATDVLLPEIGLGTWKYTGGAGPLRAGIECGAAFIDTAESYGTEEVVAEAVRGIRQNVFLATKARPRNFRPADIAAAVEGSLRRLHTDYIDLYQLHWPNHTVPIADTMGALEEMVSAGKIRYIGVSNFQLYDLKRAQAALSKNKIVSNQVRYSLIDRTIERKLLGYCQANRITVIAFSPLGDGIERLYQRDPGGALKQVAAEIGKTPAQIALNWCISKPGVVAITRSRSAEHVLENCQTSGWNLSSRQLEFLASRIGFHSRGPGELLVRALARRVLQRFGRGL